IEYIRAQRVVAMVNAAEGKGEAKGRAEEKYSLAKGFLKEGFPIETIAKVTGLSINEIKSL
ncbi:putative transposase/invertase (TIGR01784 family), partial [Hallerella porci]